LTFDLTERGVCSNNSPQLTTKLASCSKFSDRPSLVGRLSRHPPVSVDFAHRRHRVDSLPRDRSPSRVVSPPFSPPLFLLLLPRPRTPPPPPLRSSPPPRHLHAVVLYNLSRLIFFPPQAVMVMMTTMLSRMMIGTRMISLTMKKKTVLDSFDGPLVTMNFPIV